MEIIIVLGNRQESIYKKRVDAAVKHFLSSDAEVYTSYCVEPCVVKYLLFSGGASDGKSTPEGAVLMNEYCKQVHKVDEKFILTENESRTTLENLLLSKKLLADMFTLTHFPPKITICTSSFHIKRSIILTKLVFENYVTSFIHTDEPVTRDEYIHEQNILNKEIDIYVAKNTSTINYI